MKLISSIILIAALFAVACKAESPAKPAAGKSVEPASVAVADVKPVDHEAIETALSDFSKAIATKDTKLFVAITNSKSVYLVRKFASGNLGSRGSELSAEYASSSIAKDMSFAVKNQTSFELPTAFVTQPIKSYASLPKYPLPPEVDTAHYDQWAPVLLKALTNKPEAGPGDPVILKSAKYWIFAEAQIIDGVLVGSFAAFVNENNKATLAAIVMFL
jgi:hypothetical protein